MMDNPTVITLDIDWVPDFVIDSVAGILREAGVRATWFATHPGDAVTRIRADDLFELGIHPNFLPGSTQGSSVSEVLKYCMDVVPDAVCMRTHAMVQSSPLLMQVMRETPIEADSSLFLPYMPNISPVELRMDGRSLIRMPFYWADDNYMGLGSHSWKPGKALMEVPGMKIFTFHPIHVYLNSPDMTNYNRAKELGPISELTARDLAPYVHEGEGVRVFFKALIEGIRSAGNSLSLGDLVSKHRNERSRLDDF